jgi:hypothetical protein
MDNLFGNIKKMNKADNENANEKKMNREEVLANYSFDYEIEEEVKEFLKDVTYKIHSTTHKFYTELGQMLSEAQEKLSNNKSGVFIKWAESLGIKKDNAYRYINRYKYIVAIRDNITVAKVESLPFSLSSEIAKESVPESIREKVINGEIKTIKEFRNELKEVKIEVVEDIQEAEIVESYEDKIKFQLEVIMNSLSRVEKGCSYNEKNFEVLLKIQGMLDKME